MDKKEFETRLAQAANRTWQAIGFDVLNAAEADSLPRDEVVECVMDYLSMYGRDKEVSDAFEHLPFEEKVQLLTKAFPYERYGF
jgi:hypothetical protein